jgi:hypothetical protein
MFILITTFVLIFNFDDTVNNFSLSVHLGKNCKNVSISCMWYVIFLEYILSRLSLPQN